MLPWMPPYSYWVVLNGLSRGVNFSLFTLLICWSMNSLFPGFSMFLWCVMLSSKVDFFLGRISWARSRFTARFLVYFLFFSSISSPWSKISCTVLSQKVKWSYILAPSGREVKFTQPSLRSKKVFTQPIFAEYCISWKSGQQKISR